MAVKDELRLLLDDLLGDDPRRALIAYRRLTADELPWLEQRVVALARREQWNWARIGRLLGRSRQSVQARFRAMPISPRPYPRAAAQAQEAAFFRLLKGGRIEEDDVVGW